MQIKLERIEDKVEFFEALTLKDLESKVNEKIEQNQAILLNVHSVSHQSHIDYESGKTYFTAVVHFKTK
ncbi:DUF2536 family protein [Bacillus solimangrovi]|uniref:DUF2536 domain-containing protein n=1 Tax=Bacillus solimangrovi TaxID=1305675 RepID=A0A1E5LBQ1_9BACI|nr:DUF2536 family protein [Bacillus solimangrovi]OEH91525.1 hypothetical protein BFG57_05275 [Bacillus solimangrovi]